VRRALITGASSGIGEATARAFASAGFEVALVARSRARLTALATELQALGCRAEVFVIDLAEVAQVRARIESVIAAFGEINVLVNGAGMAYTGVLGDMPLEDWQQVMTLNVTSVFQVVQAVLPGMRSLSEGGSGSDSEDDSEGGVIVNIASIAAQQSFPEWGAYGVSKSALVALSGAIAAEEADNGIRVVTISPGSVNTEIWDTDTVQADFDRSAMLTADTVAQTILHAALLPPNAVIPHLTITPSQGAL